MKIRSRLAVVFTLAVLAAAVLAPVARADDQGNKNTWRNAAIGAGAATLYGLVNHQNTTSWLGAAGTAYSLKRYEDARHAQSVANARRAYYYRHPGHPTYVRNYYVTKNYYYTSHGRRHHRVVRCHRVVRRY